MDKDEARAREVLRATIGARPSILDLASQDRSDAVAAMLAFAAEARADQKERDAQIAEELAIGDGCDFSCSMITRAIRSQDHD